MAERGIRAALYVPLSCAGRPVLGWAAFVTVSRPHAWSAEVVDETRRFGMLLTAALLRHDAARDRDEQLRLQALALDVSSGFVELPADRVEEGVTRALQLTARSLGADRASAWLRGDGDEIRRIASWPDAGLPDHRGREEEPWLAAPLEQHLREHRPYAIGAVTELPAAERDPLLVARRRGARGDPPPRRDACAGLARVLVPAAARRGPSERSRTRSSSATSSAAPSRAHATPSGCA